MNTYLKELTQVEAVQSWREAEDFLCHAVTDDDPDNYILNVKAFIFAGMHRLWKLTDEQGEAVAYAVVNVYTNDGLHNVAQMYLATSKGLAQMLDHWDEFLVWAIKMHVDYIEIIGRKGWEKVLRPFGFTHNHTSLIRRVHRELH